MLKIRDGFVLRNIIDEYVVMPVGVEMNSFSNLLVLNETGAYLWRCLQNGVPDEKVLVEQLHSEYDVTIDEAHNDVSAFVQELQRLALLDC